MEAGVCHIGVPKVGLDHVRLTEVGPGYIRSNKADSVHAAACDLGVFQDGALHVSPEKVHVDEVGRGEVAGRHSCLAKVAFS